MSVWCYMQWRSESKNGFLITGLVSTVLALLTKEIAVVIPPIILLYELLLGGGAAKIKLDLLLPPAKHYYRL